MNFLMQKTIIINTTEQTIPTFFTEAQDYLQKFDTEPKCPVCQQSLELHIKQHKEADKLVIQAHLQCPDGHISVCITRRENKKAVIPFPSPSELQKRIISQTDQYYFKTWAETIKLDPCPKCNHDELRLVLRRQQNDGSGIYQMVLLVCKNCKCLVEDTHLMHGGPVPLTQEDIDVLYRAGAIQIKLDAVIAESLDEDDEAKNIVAELADLHLLYGYGDDKATPFQARLQEAQEKEEDVEKTPAEKLWYGLSPYILGAFSTHIHFKRIEKAFSGYFLPKSLTKTSVE